MCLSDYEIKLVIKTFQKRSKSNRLECFDYYKIGLINFYKGNYINAYNNFKRAYNMKLKDNLDSSSTNNNLQNLNLNNSNNKREKKFLNSKNELKSDDNSESNYNSNSIIANIAKWLSFSGMILVFCNSNKNDSFNIIDFRSIISIKLEEFEQEENAPFLFDCCSVRKKDENGKNINNMLKTKNNANIFKVDNLFVGNDLNLIKHDLNSIAKEIEDLLKIVSENEKNKIEGSWLSMIIALYCETNKNTKIFKEFLDPKYYIKVIKNVDNYMSYIVYSHMMYILKDDFKIDVVLNELIQKFKYRLEAYFFYWNLLYKGKFKNYNTANLITEILIKITSLMKFDDNNIYLIYVTILHTKSAFLIGNSSYMISFFQKEYPLNFYYPSLYYLFGKYASKSNSKNLRSISISCLKEVYRLLYEDLQILSLYWLGNIYYNSGDYINCYKAWKEFYKNIDKSFDFKFSKENKIKEFLKDYEILCENIFEFKDNINYMFSINFQISVNQVDNFFLDLGTIRNIQPNLKSNNLIYYEYLKGLIQLNVLKNTNEAINIFSNILNFNNSSIKVGFKIWDLLFNYAKINTKPLENILNKNKDKKNFNLSNEDLEEKLITDYEDAKKKILKLLCKFSYFLLKLSHSDEISYNDWLKAYLKYSKALFLNENHDKCIMVLINLLDIFSVIPLDELKFLNQVNKKNKVSLTNNFLNFDLILKFYSKNQVYKKCEDIFYEMHLKKPDLFEEELILDGSKEKSDENGNISNDEYDENSSRSEMSKSISRYGNKFYDESFNKENENQDEMNTTNQNENIMKGSEVMLENSEEKKYQLNNSLKNNDGNNKLDDSLNVELEKKKMRTKKLEKENFKNNIEKCKIQGEIIKMKRENDKKSNDVFNKTEKNNKDKENEEKKSNTKNSFKNLGELKKNTNIEINGIDKKVKLLDPDEDLDKMNNITIEKTDKKNNMYDISMTIVKTINNVNKNETKQKDDFDQMEELYTDNIENDDEIYEDEAHTKIKLPDLNIRSLSKFEEYLDNNIENIEIVSDNFTFITIISNPIIFYYIGKYCAKSAKKLELGLLCISDFKHILKFQNNYNLPQKMEIKRIKSNFWKGIILVLQKQYKLAKEKLEKIQKLLEINEKHVKANFIRRYFEWYSKFISHSTYDDFPFSLQEILSL